MTADLSLLATLASFAASAALICLTRRLDGHGTPVPALAARPTSKEPA